MIDNDDDARFDSLADADPDDIEYMFAQTAKGLSINMDGRITLNNVSAATLWFSERPYRLAGHVATDELVASWDQGDDSFAKDPPNALLSIIEDNEVNDVVVVLSDPKLTNGDLSHAVQVTEGELAPSDGPVSCSSTGLGGP